MLGFPLLYFKGMRLMMFQLSSFYCTGFCAGFGKGSMRVVGCVGFGVLDLILN